MSEEEAWEYLNEINLPDLRRPGGDPRCDMAVAAICRVNRSLLRTRLNADGRSRNGPGVLAMYATKFLLQAAKTRNVGLIEEAMVCLDVANLVANDPEEANGPLDRFIVMVGAERSETDLVGAAIRFGVSEDLLRLIRRRIGRISR